jgi:hypothetical protein
MTGGASASPRAVLRSRRPQNTPRSFMHENRETSEAPLLWHYEGILEAYLQDPFHRLRE